jgi:hypothetical protein
VTAAATWPVTPLWEAVTRRDDRRCTCHGACGRKHYRVVRRQQPPPAGSPSTRCGVAALTRAPLVPGDLFVVAPRDPATSAEHAAHLPAAELATWCPACWDGATAAARKAARQAPAPAVTGWDGENPGLF